MRHLVRFTATMALFAVAGCGSDGPPREHTPTPTIAITAPRIPGGIERALFSPELVLTHADAIALDTDQRSRITLAATTTQAALVQLDAQLDVRAAVLARVLAQSPIDEEAAVAAARDVMAIEDEIKLVHLRMLVQIRNALTVDQQARLATPTGT